jgi:hypothetical protein
MVRKDIPRTFAYDLSLHPLKADGGGASQRIAALARQLPLHPRKVDGASGGGSAREMPVGKKLKLIDLAGGDTIFLTRRTQ